MAREYTPEEKAAALAALEANRGNLKRTARECGLPVTTLRRWDAEVGPDPGRTKDHGGPSGGPDPEANPARTPKKHPPTPVAAVEAARTILADELERAVRGMVGQFFDEAKLREAGLKDTATTVGILIDKMRLLRGEATGHDSRSAGLVERIAAAAALLDILRARRSGGPPGLGGALASMPAPADDGRRSDAGSLAG